MWFHHVRQSPDVCGRTIAVNYCKHKFSLYASWIRLFKIVDLWCASMLGRVWYAVRYKIRLLQLLAVTPSPFDWKYTDRTYRSRIRRWKWLNAESGWMHEEVPIICSKFCSHDSIKIKLCYRTILKLNIGIDFIFIFWLNIIYLETIVEIIMPCQVILINFFWLNFWLCSIAYFKDMNYSS